MCSVCDAKNIAGAIAGTAKVSALLKVAGISEQDFIAWCEQIDAQIQCANVRELPLLLMELIETGVALGVLFEHNRKAQDNPPN